MEQLILLIASICFLIQGDFYLVFQTCLLFHIIPILLSTCLYKILFLIFMIFHDITDFSIFYLFIFSFLEVGSIVFQTEIYFGSKE